MAKDFTQQQYVVLKRLFAQVTERELQNIGASIGGGLNHTFILLLSLQSVREKPHEPLSYFHDVIALGGFEAGSIVYRTASAAIIERQLFGITRVIP